jgi:tetratricopeptide (TPR) repeat protein
MSNNKGSSNVFFAIVTVGVAVAAGTIAWMYIDKANTNKKIKDIDDKKVNDNKKQETYTPPISQTTNTTNTNNNNNIVYSNDVIIEDASDDDEEEEEEDDDNDIIEKKKQEEILALKVEYDRVTNTAAKFMAGNKYEKAAEKYSELIQLASKIPSQSKDLITLYNNRSAMYEKCGDFKQSLSDIQVVLTMDQLHLKGRSRKGRILEAMGKIKEALNEFTLTMVIERELRGQQTPTNASKVDELVKKVAMADSEARVVAMRKDKSRQLPSKSYCRNFVETFPSTHKWYAKYRGIKLIDGIENLEKAIYDLSNGNYLSSFELANQLRTSMTDNEDNREMLSTVVELCGTEKYLKCNMDEAIIDFKQAIQLNEYNYEAELKLASIHLELGELDNAEKCYESILSKVDSLESPTKNIAKAWVFLHRSSLWITRSVDGTFRNDAIEKSMKDIDQALDIIEPFTDEYPEAKAGKLISLLKSIHILSQTKATLGLMVDNDDLSRHEKSLKEAKKIMPNHEGVRLLEIDTKLSSFQFDESLQLIDELMKLSDPGDSIPYVMKGNVLTQKAIYDVQNSQGNPSVLEASQKLFKDVEALYGLAIKIEPNGLEGLIQYAHMMNMIGQSEQGEKLVKDALAHCRSRDDIIELSQLLALTYAQTFASNIIRPMLSNN